MKQIRTTSTVLLDAQINKRGIAVVKLEEFKFLGNTSVVLVGYYEQQENATPSVGAPLYNLMPLPVKDGIAGRQHVKRLTLLKANMDALFTAANTDVLVSESFSTQLTEVLTDATLIKIVADENYSKVDENNMLTPLTASDWEIIHEQELVTEA
ncbi:hypothetical protein BN863_28440 [Formosa agariphila KMM 3901]|uniref:Uncharacterized protein n=1 Tax=Formosa agariphila (strain DSM 15362 / KCTC 12365 / LMG 23005 / KMM 3901 / M-2Alg 35-1) TaxID=1347342 RepID=T2KQ22_FORAG|nr:hypothetical protein [Formosa agariphila]CDF80556.1 hypothetical protein BN863_28440 [Formosa agariphila KMM 3901]